MSLADSPAYTVRKYGVRAEHIPPDALRFRASATRAAAGPLPAAVDLRDRCPPVYDQGSLGSCTANALAAAQQVLDPDLRGSRLFLYYNERDADGSIDEDAGSTLSQGVRSLTTQGVCDEAAWPYDAAQFKTRPPQACYDEAMEHQVLHSYNVQMREATIKASLAAGFPAVVAIHLYKSFESASTAATGVVSMPGPDDEDLGWHAVLVVGYDDARRVWIVRNSWGAGWGDRGYFYLPYPYLLSGQELSGDMWVIDSVEDPTPAAPPTSPTAQATPAAEAPAIQPTAA
jgi:C1A family cysteine protease